MESTTYHLDLLLLCLLGYWSRLCVNLKKLYLKKKNNMCECTHDNIQQMPTFSKMLKKKKFKKK